MKTTDRYELAYYELHCSKCGVLDDVQSEDLDDLSEAQMGLVNFTVAHGDPVCTSCAGEITVRECWPSEAENDFCQCNSIHDCYC